MSKTPTHCPFCDLIQGAAEVSVCYEDAMAIAFMDIQPVNDGHVLVVPREHYERLEDVPSDVGRHLYDVTIKLIPAIQRVTGLHDLNIVVNSGPRRGRTCSTTTSTSSPRREGDGFDVPLPFAAAEMPPRERLEALAARIIADLRDPMRDSLRPERPRRRSGDSAAV